MLPVLVAPRFHCLLTITHVLLNPLLLFLGAHRPGLLLPGVSMFGAYQFPEVETRTLKVAALDALVDDLEMDLTEAQDWAQALTFHHQWVVLAREHAAALVLLTKEIGVVSVARCCCISISAVSGHNAGSRQAASLESADVLRTKRSAW